MSVGERGVQFVCASYKWLAASFQAHPGSSLQWKGENVSVGDDPGSALGHLLPVEGEMAQGQNRYRFLSSGPGLACWSGNWKKKD